jgi:hypothetical protein
MAVKQVFDKTVAKCERCGHVWLCKEQPPVTCPACRSPYWSRPKENPVCDKGKASGLAKIVARAEKDMRQNISDNGNHKVIAVTPDKAHVSALQCAIVNKFDCPYYKTKVPANDICKTCFAAGFWHDAKLQQLKEAFGIEDKQEIEEEPQEEIPVYKSPEEVLNALEAKEIKGREKKTGDSLELMKKKCYTCMEKFEDAQGKWYCNFFEYKQNPKYDYCRLCWELAVIWGERAVGYRKV